MIKKVGIMVKNILFVFFLGLFLVSCSQNNDMKLLDELLAKHRNLLALKRVNFELLIFRLSPFQFKNNTRNLKLILNDQLGRKWLFKFGPSSKDGAIAIYELYTLLGIFTPEVHTAVINLNGRPQAGTLQPFVENQGTFDKFSFQEVNVNIQNYLAQNHLLSWVAANSHVQTRQFILSGDIEGKPDKVARIDNAVEWITVGLDNFSMDYRCPTLYDVPQAGYSEFFRTYLRGLTEIDFNIPLKTARLLQLMPDDVFRSFFIKGVNNDFKYLSNLQDDDVLAELFPDLFKDANKNFLEILVKRKNTVEDDFRAFYQKLITLRVRPPAQHFEKISSTEVLRERIAGVDHQISLANEEFSKIGEKRVYPSVIRAVVSYEASLLLQKIYHPKMFLNKNIKNDIQKIQNELKLLYEKTDHPMEKMAVKQAINLADRAMTEDEVFQDIYFLKKKLQTINRVFSIVPMDF